MAPPSSAALPALGAPPSAPPPPYMAPRSSRPRRHPPPPRPLRAARAPSPPSSRQPPRRPPLTSGGGSRRRRSAARGRPRPHTDRGRGGSRPQARTLHRACAPCADGRRGRSRGGDAAPAPQRHGARERGPPANARAWPGVNAALWRETAGLGCLVVLPRPRKYPARPRRAAPGRGRPAQPRGSPAQRCPRHTACGDLAQPARDGTGTLTRPLHRAKESGRRVGYCGDCSPSAALPTRGLVGAVVPLFLTLRATLWGLRS